MKAEEKRIYEFGEFRLETGELELYRRNERLALPQKSLEMLAFLIERRGQTVTKNELLDEIWRDTFVDENNLAVNVAALRRAFGVKATDKTFIETVSRRGYRFTADVREISAQSDLIFEKLTETRITLNETRETLESENKINVLTSSSRRRHRTTLFAAVVVVLLGGFLVYFYRSSFNQISSTAPIGAANIPRTIAVLPLKNLSAANETDEALSIGLTDALISRLGNIRGLAVRPTSAVLAFPNENQTPALAGEKLNVEAVLDGRIHRENNRIRVSVQLVKTADGAVLWAENFDERDADLFKIEDSISTRIADALRLKITDAERAQLARRQTEDFEAYKLYLRGRHAWNKRTKEGLQNSIQLFQQAIDRDPAFALAFAGLADSYALLSEYNVAPPMETFPKAKAAANRALEIDLNLAEAHTTLAYVLASYDWNFAEAGREYLRAIELNLNYATAHQWYGELLMGLQRFDEAEREFNRAAELDPFSPIIQCDLGLLAYYKRDYDAAIVHYQKTIQSFPNFPTVYAQITLVYERQGNFDEAAGAMIEFLRLSGIDEKGTTFMREVYKKQGYKGFLQMLVAGTNDEAQKRYVPAFVQAFYYARLGDRENTLIWAEKAFDERHRYVAYIEPDPDFDFLRDDPRFQNLLERVRSQPSANF